MNKMSLAALAMFTVLLPTAAQAAVINFEKYPDGNLPQKGDKISTQYQSAYGVSFSLVDHKKKLVGFPVIAATSLSGDKTREAWTYSKQSKQGIADVPAPGHENTIGNFTLSYGIPYGFPAQKIPSTNLLISYDNPVQAASGAIIDIDSGVEAWRIDARDAIGNVIDSVTMRANPSNLYDGDGEAKFWSFNFTDTGKEISSLLIDYIGNTSTGHYPGVAFDYFSASSEPRKSVPEPSSTLGLLALSTFGVSSLLKRKQQQKVLNLVGS